MTERNRSTNCSISTMWAIRNYPHLNDFFGVASALGFQKIELNHQVNAGMLADVDLDHHEFSGVHEPCPADVSVQQLVERDWLISATDEESRRTGVKKVKQSIDLAHRLGGSVVILHCGRIPFSSNYEDNLRDLYRTIGAHTVEFIKLRAQFQQARYELITPRLEAVKKSLEELIAYASRYKVRLGLENRYHYMDIPSPDEMEELLSLADASALGFVYDVGHAQTLDQLGFFPHREWLKRFSSRMFGCHLHDLIGLTDHYAPGLGEINFASIAEFIPEPAFRTLEVLPGNTLAQVKDGLQTLVQAGCIHYI